MDQEEIRTIVVPRDGSMPFDKETGDWLLPSEVFDLVEAGHVLNADGSPMTIEQFEALASGTE